MRLPPDRTFRAESGFRDQLATAVPVAMLVNTTGSFRVETRFSSNLANNPVDIPPVQPVSQTPGEATAAPHFPRGELISGQPDDRGMRWSEIGRSTAEFCTPAILNIIFVINVLYQWLMYAQLRDVTAVAARSCSGMLSRLNQGHLQRLHRC